MPTSAVSELKAWAESRGGTLFQEPSRGAGWNARPYLKSAVGVLSSFAPGLPAQVAQAFADEALALAAGRLTSRGKFDDLAAGTAKLGNHDPVTQLDHQSLWQHNQDLAARLRLLLPPLPGSATQQSADELRTLLSNLPAAIQHELADEWVPHELHKCSAGPADALSRLRPAPLSLLLRARQLSYEASRRTH